MQHVYITYNALSKTWGAPVVRDADPQTYAKQLSDTIVLNPDIIRKDHGDECQVYHLGEFDQTKGIILFSNPDQSGDIILDCIQCFKQLEALKNAAAAN